MKITNLKTKVNNFKKKLALILGLTVPLASCSAPADEQGISVDGRNEYITVDEMGSTDEPLEAIVEDVEVTTNENGDSVKITEAKTEDGETIKITETTNEKGETVKVVERKDKDGKVIEHVEKTTTEKTTTEKTTKEKDKNKTEKDKKNTVTTAKETTKKITTTQAKKTEPAQPKQTQPVQTQPKQTQPVQTQPIQTQPPVTQPPVTQPVVTTIPYSERTYTKYDITSDDPEIAINAFEQLAEDLDIFNGYVHQNQYGGTLGGWETYGILIALNHNQNINPEALNYFFEYDSEEEFEKYCDNIDLAYYQALYGSNIDFRKYVIDENLANFINNVSKQYKDAQNGNRGPLDNTINSYFAANSESIDDYVKYYFMTCTKDEYNDYNSDEMNYARELYFENVVKPVYHNFKGRNYTR